MPLPPFLNRPCNKHSPHYREAGMTIKRFALTAVMLTAVAILLLASAGARRGRSCSPDIILSGCSVSSQGKIEWEQKPVITADGYLVMRGTAKDDARIHSATKSYAGNFWPSFNLSLLDERSESGGDRLKTAANIWPRRMASQLARSSRTRVFADSDGYQVTAAEFYVKAKLPDSLLNPDSRLVVSVWEQNPGLSSGALGAECVDRE